MVVKCHPLMVRLRLDFLEFVTLERLLAKGCFAVSASFLCVFISRHGDGLLEISLGRVTKLEHEVASE